MMPMLGLHFSSCWIVGILLPTWATKLQPLLTPPTDLTVDPRLWSCTQVRPELTNWWLRLLPSWLGNRVGSVSPNLRPDLKYWQSRLRPQECGGTLASIFSEVGTSCLFSSELAKAKGGLLVGCLPATTDSLVLSWMIRQSGKEDLPLSDIGSETESKSVVQAANLAGLLLLGTALELSTLRALLMRTPTKKHRLLLAAKVESTEIFLPVFVTAGMQLQSLICGKICEASVLLPQTESLLGWMGWLGLVAGLWLDVSQSIYFWSIFGGWSSNHRPVVSRLWKKRTAGVRVGSDWMPHRTLLPLPDSRMPLRSACHLLLLDLVGKSAELIGEVSVRTFLRGWPLVFLTNSITGQLRLVGRSANLVSDSYPAAGPSTTRK